ncbi:MAG: CvpA family protein [Planctomycetia bacterium]
MPGTGLSTLDLVLVAVVALFALRGALKGFVWQVIRFVAAGLAFACASLADDPLAPVLRSVFPSLGEAAAPSVAWSIVFFLVLLLGTWAAHLARGLVHSVALAGVDRIAGFLLGAATGVLFSLLVVVMGGAWLEASGRQEQMAHYTKGSQLLAPLGRLADTLGAYLPQGARSLWLEVRPAALPPGGTPASAPGGTAGPGARPPAR